MQPTTKNTDVTTYSGRRVQIIHVQHWFDTSSKDDPYGRAPGRKELRTSGGQGIVFDGSVFRMSDGPEDQAPATPEALVRVRPLSDPKVFKRHFLRMFEQGQPRYADLSTTPLPSLSGCSVMPAKPTVPV